jgi:hypothetical protein
LELLTGDQAFVGSGSFGGQVVANLHQCDQLMILRVLKIEHEVYALTHDGLAYGATSYQKSTLAWIETTEINKFPP